jgi:hypothetical protein
VPLEAVALERLDERLKRRPPFPPAVRERNTY